MGKIALILILLGIALFVNAIGFAVGAVVSNAEVNVHLCSNWRCTKTGGVLK